MRLLTRVAGCRWPVAGKTVWPPATGYWPLLLALLAACTTTAPPPAPAPAATGAVYGLKLEDEAAILRLEDRREFDPAMAEAWLANPNPLQRARMVVALARIGPHTFVDTNGNGERDPGEHQAGVELFARVVSDADRNVRENAAFALGEIGDPTGIDALLRFAHDTDPAVAAEAIEALSKMAAQVTLARYAEFTGESWPEGVRTRALRFLFRFNSDDASAIAAKALDSNTAVIRESAAYALARRGFAAARAQLEILLNDKNEMTRSYAASALGRIGDKQSIGPLLAAAHDEHPWVRTNALVAMTRVAAKDATALARPEIAQDVLRVIELTDDSDAGARASSIDVLGLYAPRSELAKKRLAEITSTGSRWDRELAWGAWAKQFDDAKPQTNWEKVRVIENRFTRAWADDPDPLLRETTLGNIPDTDVEANLDIIRKGLDDRDVIVRSSAIERYAKTKEREVAVLLAAEQRSRNDASNDARLAAIGALSEIDRPEREAFLRGLLADRDPVVRRIAADQIEEKLKKNRPQFTPLAVDRGAEYARIAEWSHTPHSATIHTARGNIAIALLAGDAPITAWNFAELAKKHYFDNSSFMRVVPNFVIQGGDPRNDMNGGPGYAIRDEINLQKYTRGAVGMALSGPDTGGSQFFITHSSTPHLDGGYTIFARLTSGMTAVVDQIERGDRVETVTVER
jgi:cyclophilin family peptidyl-prolyl cis-trans isomerase/HEAT repeat protein